MSDKREDVRRAREAERLGTAAKILRTVGPGGLSAALDVMEDIGSDLCQCCRTRLSRGTFYPGTPIPRNHRTRGHLLASRSLTIGHRYWIRMCLQCNQDQDDMSFWGWLQTIASEDSDRGHFVLGLLLVMLALGVPPHAMAGRHPYDQRIPARPLLRSQGLSSGALVRQDLPVD